MPSKTNKKQLAGALPSLPKELIDRFLSGPMRAESVNAVAVAFKKAPIERARHGAQPSTELPARRRQAGQEQQSPQRRHRQNLSGHPLGVKTVTEHAKRVRYLSHGPTTQSSSQCVV